MPVISADRVGALGRVQGWPSGEARTWVLMVGLVVLSALAFGVMNADGALAAAPWSAPATVFEDADRAPGALAYSGDGRALVAGSRGSGFAEEQALVTLATRTPTGRYRQFRAVAGEAPQVVAYGQTRAVVLRYLVEDKDLTVGGIARVGVSYGRTYGDIDPVKVIDRFRFFVDGPPLMAASDDGRIAIVYNDRTQGTGALRLAVREPGGDFEQRLIGPPGAQVLALDVGVNGDIVVAWQQEDLDGGPGTIKARVQRRGHGLGRTEDLGPAAPTTNIDASVADNGQIAVTWSTGDFRSNARYQFFSSSPVVVRAAIRPAGPHRFEATQTLYDSSSTLDRLTSVAVDSSEDAATVAWTAGQVDPDGRMSFSVMSATPDATGRFAASTTVAQDGAVEDVLVDSDGSATVVWTPPQVDAEGQPSRREGLLAAARTGPDAAYGPVEMVSDERTSFARLASNPEDGRVTALWNGDFGRLAGSTRD